jgi:hypothetical protein
MLTEQSVTSNRARPVVGGKNMKAYVWTSRNCNAADYESGKPKCIFMGEISAAPRVDDYIVLREGFGAEIVRSVIYDFVTDEIEICITGMDVNNYYGPCLYG